ncbi:hypothetical protein [Streptomyces sp. MST-110588]|uniref:hypothetical protein n=1 Tax=Streptomyces sp. MST-110588 TaxID=2833628 RepID=UPI001F5C3F0D|nr:hypothetical protein [Streptomyces sp. MST-110588]UNO40322.1 hypothetical protein KGS77_12950 [Streptomyces sp. MST-110588]
MSYPNQNNPYGPPQGQPGYGYPQQPMQPMQPQPYAAYPGGGMMPGGMPGMPMTMPGGVKAARVLLFVIAGLGLIGLIFAVIGLNSVNKASHTVSAYGSAESQSVFNFGKGLLIFMIIAIVLFAATAIVLGLQFAKGGNGVRIGTIIFGSVVVLFSLLSFPVGILHMVMGILIIVFVSKADGGAWFNRPRY